VLHLEAQTHPKMMSVGLHCRIVGRPGRIGGPDEFLGYIGSFDDVWVTTRADVAGGRSRSSPERRVLTR
jgi:hypothetical protein